MKKRSVTLVPIIIISFFIFTVSASAAVISRTYSNNFVDDFTVNLYDENGRVNFQFYKADVWGPNTHVEIYIPPEATGRTYTFIACHSYEARAGASNEIVVNKIMCDAYLTYESYATKVNFYANRKVNGVTTAWDYTYTADNHGNPQ